MANAIFCGREGSELLHFREDLNAGDMPAPGRRGGAQTNFFAKKFSRGKDSSLKKCGEAKNFRQEIYSVTMPSCSENLLNNFY
jgi:hypothetical protein